MQTRQCTEFYVSPTGADGNPGTQAQPFKTLTQARDAVRAVSPQMSGDIVVYLRAGISVAYAARVRRGGFGTEWLQRGLSRC